MLAISGLVVDAQVAEAAPTGITYYVNSAGDTGASAAVCATPSNTTCGVDDAINAFNADTTADDADAIVFSSAISTFSSEGTGISNGTSGVTLDIHGNGQSATAVSGGGTETVFTVSGGTVTISGLTIEDGDGVTGGGVYNTGNATLSDDTISGNTAALGGALYNASMATVSDDTFSENKATSGGGIYNYNASMATLRDDTFSGNSATSGGGVDNDGTATLSDDTFSGNSAFAGAGLFDGGTTTLANTILDDGTGECDDQSTSAIADGGYNVEDDDSCDLGNSSTVGSSTIDLAASLAPNGSNGPETLAIGPTSSAFAEVPIAACIPTTDERGVSRPGVAGENCDAGAFEAQGTVFATAACPSTWSVPDGVTSVDILAVGAAGGSGSAIGGTGDGMSATLSTSPGQTLDVCVDVGGGGTPIGGVGGGASGVSTGSTFASPVLVAGGGGGGAAGGGGFDGDGGNAGSPAGSAGTGENTGTGGGGGDTATSTPGAGGVGPAVGGEGAATTSAGPGQGGYGGALENQGGGGGGAGYYGGGGGASSGGVATEGGGGGGSDFCSTAASVTNCAVLSGAGLQTVAGSAPGDAQVILTYVVAGAPTATITSPANNQSYDLNQVVDTTFTCDEGPSGSGLSSCDDNNGTDTTAGGSGTLDTSSPGGPFTYTVTATSSDGLMGTASITYSVINPACPAGSYNATNGDTPCTTTPAGYYDSGMGNTAPTPCPAGTYNPNTGSTSESACIAAPNDTYDAGTGNSAATPCPANTSNTGTGNTFCTAPTTLTYTGVDEVGTNSSFTPTATLSSPVTACQSGQPVTFSLSADPLNGTSETYPLGNGGTSTPSGSVTDTPAVSTKGWENGVYTITATYAGTSTGTTQCAPATAMAPLAVTVPGQFAFGYGAYTPSAGPTSFGFVVSQTTQIRGKTMTTTYGGALDVVTPGKWLFQANVTNFGLTSSTQGLLSGTGSLYYWNTSLNRGHGGWQLAKANVTYNATANATTKTSPGSFGVTISYTPTAGQPATLPNSSLLPVSKGGIFIT